MFKNKLLKVTIGRKKAGWHAYCYASFWGRYTGINSMSARVREALTMWTILIVSIILAFVGMGTAVLSSALVGFLVSGLGIVGMSAYCIVVIVDFFAILVGKFKDAEGKYVTK